MARHLLTKTGAICMVEGSVQAAVFALSALAADLVVLALHVVVAEGTGTDVYCIPAWGAILHAHTDTAFLLPVKQQQHLTAYLMTGHAARAL